MATSNSAKSNKTVGCAFAIILLLCSPFIGMMFLVTGITTLLGGGEDGFDIPEQEQTTGVNQDAIEKSSGFPQAAEQYYPIYVEAGKKYGVPWNIIAAIHSVESSFGADTGKSVDPKTGKMVGAQGHTQFMDKTWLGWSYPGGTKSGDLPDSLNNIINDPKMIAKYGGYGVDADGDGVADRNNPKDALHATAKYLAANYKQGGSWEKAIWLYNHSQDYVNLVMQRAHQYANTVPTGGPTTGNNGTALPSTGKFAMPTKGSINTSSYGMRFHPIKHVWKMHTGLDMAAPAGTPIFAADNGKVVSAGTSSGYGHLITIDHGGGIVTRYAHMYANGLFVKAGDAVTKGQKIGAVGSDGYSTGPHLHFEVMVNGQFTNPLCWISNQCKPGEKK
ncbi:Murein DD-endopeptidase MepM and murein hydrolase activator NlpD, contain LysM domain [Seinonella peptonophila]|uniref:Murein DD-endopeptidase MepM and murein hydrolase activator NlpD, contain LysM domain n=1 Tax=Seinonella peptonophila TaxID=112248 RepID=A0A1M4WLZ7_9BACL|nr:peptidoglycan DD-metalloendopeptidase family protein [Seinonella peptonophila]SHE82073.1 Murein DD-endopeptidase MepM and murein hydrolase activator NlpD, contain LysM domain [Seinonella peptonophila]